MNSLRLVTLSLLTCLAGCTATQLRYQTLNEGETLESITEKQIFFNLGQFDQDPYAFPSQVTVIAGSASTTDSVSPTFMVPLGTSSLVTTQLANMTSSSLSTAAANMTSNSVATAVSAGTQNTTTNTIMAGSVGGPVTGASTMTANQTTGGTTATTTNGTTGSTTTTNMTGANDGTTTSTATTRPNSSLSLALTDNWMESWTLDPVVNPDVLRRLSALYRYVLGESDAAGEDVARDKNGFPNRRALKAWADQHKQEIDDQFICDYPLSEASVPGTSGASPTISTKLTTKTDHNEPLEITKSGPDPHATVAGSITVTIQCLINSKGDRKNRAIKAMLSSMKPPACVVCLDDSYDQQAVDGAAKPIPEEAPHVVRPLYVNPNLNFGFITRATASIESDGKTIHSNVYLGHGFYGDVNIDPNPHRAFHEFELFIDSATIVGTSNGAAGGTNPKVLSVPISPNGFLLE